MNPPLRNNDVRSVVLRPVSPSDQVRNIGHVNSMRSALRLRLDTAEARSGRTDSHPTIGDDYV